ncbi:MAG: HAD family hydrolase [Candidatus Promineifilaceae bacterium]
MDKKRDIRLVVSDLDGTLLDGSGRLPAANEAAIRRILGQGVQFVLATGKTRASAEPVIAHLGLRSPGVYFQGHIICDADGRILRERWMPREHADAVFDYLRAQGLEALVYDRSGLWATAEFPERRLIHEKYGEPLPPINPEPSAAPGVNKILVASGGREAELRRELERRFGARLRILRAVPEFIEVMSPDVTKGEGVAWLANEMGIDLRHVLAIGDGENDVEMLQLAGFGVAVANAMPAAKAAADAIVASNDDSGVAEALARYV